MPATEHSWNDDVPQLLGAIAPDEARQPYAVLCGMTGASGAMVAAATLGMPEHALEKRNYDFRYAWIRDEYYAGQAAEFPTNLISGCPDILAVPRKRGTGSMNNSSWMPSERRCCSWPLPPPMTGYLENWRAAEPAVQAITDRWQEPDAGIWEINNDRWAHSWLICAAGLRAVAVHAPAAQGAPWTSLADAIVADTARDCLYPSGRWRRIPGDNRMHAALLLPALRGALRANDPRSLAAVEGVRAELGREGHVYRFSQDTRPLAQTEGAFLLCGFNLVMAVHQQGHETEAMHWFERNPADCAATGPFTEEYDDEPRQLRGNVPQAFVHATMLEAASRLATAPKLEREYP